MPPGEGSAEEEEPAEARYLRKLLVWDVIKEFETKEGHDYSDQLGEGWKAPMLGEGCRNDPQDDSASSTAGKMRSSWNLF